MTLNWSAAFKRVEGENYPDHSSNERKLHFKGNIELLAGFKSPFVNGGDETNMQKGSGW